MREFLVVSILFAVGALSAAGYWYIFYRNAEPDPRYWEWDATITYIWFNPSPGQSSQALGNGRYKIRLPNGRHEEARSYDDSVFHRYDCVLVREYLSPLTRPIRFEVVGRAEECWQPEVEKSGNN